jgi:CheY-like chemotaxis protein
MSGATAAELDAARLLLARMGITPTTTRCFSAACAPCSIPPLEVVAETATSDEAVAATTERQPDVVVMDIQMSGLNGIDATRELQLALAIAEHWPWTHDLVTAFGRLAALPRPAG